MPQDAGDEAEVSPTLPEPGILTQKTLILGGTSDPEPPPESKDQPLSTPQRDQKDTHEPVGSSLQRANTKPYTAENDGKHPALTRPKVLEGLTCISPQQQEDLTKRSKGKGRVTGSKKQRETKSRRGAASTRTGKGSAKGKGRRSKNILRKSKSIRKARSEVVNNEPEAEVSTQQKRRRLRRCASIEATKVKDSSARTSVPATTEAKDSSVPATTEAKGRKVAGSPASKRQPRSKLAGRKSKTCKANTEANSKTKPVTNKRKAQEVAEDSAKSKKADKSDKASKDKKAKASRKSSAYHKAYKAAIKLGLEESEAKKLGKEATQLQQVFSIYMC